VTDLENDTAVFGRFHGSFRRLDSQRERLLDKHMLPGGCRSNNQIGVGGVRRCQQDAINVVGAKDLLIASECNPAVCLDEFITRLGTASKAADDLSAGGDSTFGQNVAPPAKTDGGQPNRIIGSHDTILSKHIQQP
jgi:hypothetical protein